VTPEMKAYVALLRLPMHSLDGVKFKPEIQAAMATLREHIVERSTAPSWSHSQVVQTIFEDIARAQSD